MKKEDLVMAKLNELTILEFTRNYDKSELQRFFEEETKEEKTLKNDIKEIMYSLYDKNKYDINVNNNFVAINEIIEKKENSLHTKEVEKIWSSNFYKLPRIWVMGKKISKKLMLETLNRLD